MYLFDVSCGVFTEVLYAVVPQLIMVRPFSASCVDPLQLFLAAVGPPVSTLLVSFARYDDDLCGSVSTTGRVSLPALVPFVAVCVRVCWPCYRLGGTDVADLPDVRSARPGGSISTYV